MPRRTPGPKPGTVKKPCGCGTPINLSMACCTSCWPTLTDSLQRRWRDAKYGEYNEAALERAGQMINEFLRKEAAS